MTTLTLYKGVVFDGVNSFPHITSKETFVAYLAGKQQYSQNIHYNRIGEPILINKGYDKAIGYSYGCIDTDNKKYFIIPDSISVNENNRVYLSYSVDWYTTLIYDDALTFGRAHLIKSTGVDPLAYYQAVQPIDMRVESITPLLGHNTDDDDKDVGEIHVAYTTADESSKVKWVMCRARNGFKMRIDVTVAEPDHTVATITGWTLGVQEIMNGVLFDACGIVPSNIIGIYYVPYLASKVNYGGPWEAKYKDVNDLRYVWYELNEFLEDPPFRGSYTNINMASTAMRSIHVIDRYGSIIYSVPYGRTLNYVSFTTVVNMSSCFMTLNFVYGDSPSYHEWTPAEKSAENSFALYMCEKIDYNNDAYRNWASGLKGVEIEERRLQKNKALVSNMSGTAITTAVGAGVGGPAGAIAGAAGGMMSALASYAIDTYYESDINRLVDRKYQLTQDSMVPGGFLPGLYPTLAVVTLTASDADIARYNTEIAEFGADCNLPVSSWTPSVGAYKFADVEVIADVPYSIKQNIKQKMMSGIKIVGLE